MRPHEDAWRVRVTSRDVQVAAEAWWQARVSGASRERLVELRDDLLRLRRAQAAQRAEDGAGGEDGGWGGGQVTGWVTAPVVPAPDGVVPHQG